MPGFSPNRPPAEAQPYPVPRLDTDPGIYQWYDQLTVNPVIGHYMQYRGIPAESVGRSTLRIIDTPLEPVSGMGAQYGFDELGSYDNHRVTLSATDLMAHAVGLHVKEIGLRGLPDTYMSDLDARVGWMFDALFKHETEHFADEQDPVKTIERRNYQEYAGYELQKAAVLQGRLKRTPEQLAALQRQLYHNNPYEQRARAAENDPRWGMFAVTLKPDVKAAAYEQLAAIRKNPSAYL